MKKASSVCAAERLSSPPERLGLRAKTRLLLPRKQTIAESPARLKDIPPLRARQGPSTHGVNTLRDSPAEGRTQTDPAAQLTAFVLPLNYLSC